MRHLLACLAILAAFNAHSQVWNANADVDQDGCVGAGDVLDILSVFGSCDPVLFGCTDPLFIEFSAQATFDDGSCAELVVYGCTNEDYLEYDSNANADDGSCISVDPNSCGPVSFDGYTYDVVLIGNQCWFAENLRTTSYNTNLSIATVSNYQDWISLGNSGIGLTTIYGDVSITSSATPCQDFSPTIDACDTSEALTHFGRLYNWQAVASADLCPQGWHVPNDGEWTVLTDYVASVAGNSGTHLKDSLNWTYDDASIELGIPPGTNMFGFNLQPAGRFYYQGYSYTAAGFSAQLWTATELSENVASYRNFYYLWADVGSTHISTGKLNGLSVRCLKDAD